MEYNLQHFEISSARVGGGGATWPGPRKQGYGYQIELKFATSIGTDETFVTKISFPEGNKTSHSIFTPWNRAKLEKNHFLCLETSFLAQNYTPSPFPWFSSETKNSYVQFFETSHFKNNCSNPLVNRLC